MEIIVGIWVSNKFFDAFIVNGYNSVHQLLDSLQVNVKSDGEAIDLLNYLDSNGNGTRDFYKIEFNPSVDFSNSNVNFSCDNLSTFKIIVENIKFALAWKNNCWWNYDKTQNIWRKNK